MNLTKHASARCQQRSIPPVAIDLILDFGAVEYHRGREIILLDKKGLRKAKRYLGKLLDGHLAVLKDIYVVVAEGMVVTVARKTGHLKRKRQ